MPKVSIELYVNNEIDDSYTAQIPENKLPMIRQLFDSLMSELLFENENNDIETEEN